ncbi:hypothetical protein MMIN_23110 [Mycolicibacter minnesotensis]|nr:hypothetical protein MMIN_23110 [Mycolicibacter minnesotensis]
MPMLGGREKHWPATGAAKDGYANRESMLIPTNGRDRCARCERLLYKINDETLTHPGLARLPTLSSVHPFSPGSSA